MKKLTVFTLVSFVWLSVSGQLLKEKTTSFVYGINSGFKNITLDPGKDQMFSAEQNGSGGLDVRVLSTKTGKSLETFTINNVYAGGLHVIDSNNFLVGTGDFNQADVSYTLRLVKTNRTGGVIANNAYGHLRSTVGEGAPELIQVISIQGKTIALVSTGHTSYGSYHVIVFDDKMNIVKQRKFSHSDGESRFSLQILPLEEKILLVKACYVASTFNTLSASKIEASLFDVSDLENPLWKLDETSKGETVKGVGGIAMLDWSGKKANILLLQDQSGTGDKCKFEILSFDRNGPGKKVTKSFDVNPIRGNIGEFKKEKAADCGHSIGVLTTANEGSEPYQKVVLFNKEDLSVTEIRVGKYNLFHVHGFLHQNSDGSFVTNSYEINSENKINFEMTNFSGIPSAPRNIAKEATTTNLTVKWDFPCFTGGKATRFKVNRYSKVNGVSTDLTFETVSTSLVLPISTASTVERIVVYSVNDNGESIDSVEISFANRESINPEPIAIGEGVLAAVSADSSRPTSSTTTGMQSKTFFSVYPNPSNGRFTIQSEESCLVQIFDLTGKNVYYSEMQTGLSEIDVTHFDPGIYFVQLRTKDGIQTERIRIK